MGGEPSLVDVNEDVPGKHIAVTEPGLFCVSILLTCYRKRQTKPQKSQRPTKFQATRIERPLKPQLRIYKLCQVLATNSIHSTGVVLMSLGRRGLPDCLAL
jgi:hypothetical protein